SPNIPQHGHAMRRHMIGATVAEQHQVRDRVLAQELVEEHGPFGKASAEIDRPVGPVILIAAAEVDAINRKSGFSDCGAEPAEQRAWRPLEKYEGAPLAH